MLWNNLIDKISAMHLAQPNPTQTRILHLCYDTNQKQQTVLPALLSGTTRVTIETYLSSAKLYQILIPPNRPGQHSSRKTPFFEPDLASGFYFHKNCLTRKAIAASLLKNTPSTLLTIRGVVVKGRIQYPQLLCYILFCALGYVVCVH